MSEYHFLHSSFSRFALSANEIYLLFVSNTTHQIILIIICRMGKRGWTEQGIKDTVAKGPKGVSSDQRKPNKTPPDYLGRNDSATVYGEPGKYVVINDRTGEVTQVSDKTDPKWVDDGRIFWGNKK